MSRFKFGTSLSLSLLLLMFAGGVRAGTLYVNCGGKGPLTSIRAALKALQQVPGPSTINVSGACNENVVIQGIDHLTLNAAPGASINDVSGGQADTVDIADSTSVSLNNFTINGGADGVVCVDGSLVFVAHANPVCVPLLSIVSAWLRGTPAHSPRCTQPSYS